MIKKTAAAILAAAWMVLLTACSAGEFGVSSATGGKALESSTSAAAGSVEDTLEGLEKYLSQNASVSGKAEEMRADIIGAKKGVRYQYGYNGKNNVTLELYEFDKDNLNETARKVLSEIKEKGSFSLMGGKVPGVLSDSGKYLMIYRNSADDSENKAYGKKLEKLFRSFKKE